MKKLVELRNTLDAKRKELAAIFDAAGSDVNFNDPGVLEQLGAADSADAVDKVRARNKEIEALATEVEQLAEVAGIMTASVG